jgi:hypothetical protein
MKKLRLFLYFFPVLWMLSGPSSASVVIWVSPSGSDLQSGTNEKPLKSLHMALRRVRELRRLNDSSASDTVFIRLKEGTWFLDETILLRAEDSGEAGSPTVIESAPGEEPAISGGVPVTGWTRLKKDIPGLPVQSRGKIWVANIPKSGGKILEFRQLWVNNRKALRASSLGDGMLDRILSVDKTNEVLWIPAPKHNFREMKQLELIIHQWWAVANLRVKSLEIVGDSAKVTFHQPESRIEFEHPWPAPFIDSNKEFNGNSAFYFANSIALLNQPGEWFEDIEAGKLYYWPREGENPVTDEVIAPNLETLVAIQGTPDLPVSGIIFSGITFRHTTWLRPSHAGHVPLQAGMYLLDGYKLMVPGTPDKASLENQAWTGRQPAGVILTGADHITFSRCKFMHMAATGLDLVSATHHNTIQGCLFKDIGGTGIQAGYFGGADFEAHLPYNPSDQRLVCRDELISDNFLTDCTNEDWGCVGIGVGFASDITIEHNEISDVNYSGISVGWGWTKTINCMKNNKIRGNSIHHFAKNMYDVGGIYTLSAQPGTEITGNVLYDLAKAPYAHIPNHFQFIYLDEGSSYIRIHDNWTEYDKFYTNNNGPGTEWVNNGPQVSEEIRNKAGIRPEFKNIADDK